MWNVCVKGNLTDKSSILLFFCAFYNFQIRLDYYPKDMVTQNAMPACKHALLTMQNIATVMSTKPTKKRP